MSIYAFFIWANYFLSEVVEEHQQREGHLVESRYINSSAESITKALWCYHTAEPIMYNMKNPCQAHREYRQCCAISLIGRLLCVAEFMEIEPGKPTTPQSLSITKTKNLELKGRWEPMVHKGMGGK